MSQTELTVQEKLEAVLHILSDTIEQNNYLGGCPFLTLYTQTPIDAVEIRDRIKSFFEKQLHGVELILAQGIARQELKEELPVKQTAMLIVSSIEVLSSWLKLLTTKI